MADSAPTIEISPHLLPNTPAEVQSMLDALIKRRSTSKNSAADRDENGLRISSIAPNPFNTQSVEMRAAITSLGLNSTNDGKDKAMNNPKKVEVRQRLNRVVNAVIDGFIGQKDEQLENITNLVRNLLRTDPKAASQLLQRLLPKQIDLNLDTSERIKSSIVLVDKSKHLNVTQVHQQATPIPLVNDDNDELSLDSLKPVKLKPAEANEINRQLGLPVDPVSLKHKPLVAAPKDDSPEELARFTAELKEKASKHAQLVELKKHFPEIKIPKYVTANAKLSAIRKIAAKKRGRPKHGVPYEERAPAYNNAYRPEFDKRINKRAAQLAEKHGLPLQLNQSEDL